MAQPAPVGPAAGGGHAQHQRPVRFLTRGQPGQGRGQHRDLVPRAASSRARLAAAPAPPPARGGKFVADQQQPQARHRRAPAPAPGPAGLRPCRSQSQGPFVLLQGQTRGTRALLAWARARCTQGCPGMRPARPARGHGAWAGPRAASSTRPRAAPRAGPGAPAAARGSGSRGFPARRGSTARGHPRRAGAPRRFRPGPGARRRNWRCCAAGPRGWS
jgi:hypothetical protein